MRRTSLSVAFALSLTLSAVAVLWAASGYLPAPAVPDGWELQGEASTFGPDNLYEHIDGAAPGYLRYDFRELTVQPVQKADEPKTEILVEVYEFGKHLDAFGIYSNERAPGLDFVKLGSEGYFAGPACRFYKGPYYVKLDGTRTDDSIEEAEKAIASALARRLPGPAKAPQLLKVFPRDHLLADSERYEGSDLLAHDFMGAGFMADYQLGGEKDSKLFFAIKESRTEARSAYWKLLSFLRKRGEVGERLAIDGAKGRRVTHPFYGPSLICRSGPMVFGLLRAPADGTGEQLLGELRRRIEGLGAD